MCYQRDNWSEREEDNPVFGSGEITGTDPLTILNAGLELRAAQKAGELDAFARQIKLADMRKHPAKGEFALIAEEVEERRSETDIAAPVGGV